MSAFDWGDYLTLAQELAARRGDEAAERSAISRAHHAALGRAVALLRAEGRQVSPFKTHSAVWRAFKQSPDTRRATIGADLDRLRQMRDLADYALVVDIDLSQLATDMVDLAGTVLRALEDVGSSPQANPNAH